VSESPYVFNNSGKTIRLGRILNPQTQRAAVVAFDHGVHLGMSAGIETPGKTLEMLAEAGADAVLVGPGVARMYASVFSGRGAPGLILRLDWTNRWRAAEMLGPEEGRGCLMGSVEDAVRLGADAVLVYMFIGYENPEAEAKAVENVTHVVMECERIGMGCIIEPMARGLRVGEDIYNADYIAAWSRMACELGADILKTDYSGDADSFRKVIAASFRPVLIAGGPKTNTVREALAMLRGALDAGANGMFIGRNVFQAPDPGRMLRAMRRMVHEDTDVESALAELEG
jgi:class I fructose-bisphosphate aldolase